MFRTHCRYVICTMFFVQIPLICFNNEKVDSISRIITLFFWQKHYIGEQEPYNIRL